MYKRHYIFSVLLFSLFFFCSLVLYGRQDRLQVENKKLSMTVEDFQKKNELELTKLNERLSVVDASISPDNKKWARIKHIRKIVIDVMKQKGVNNLTILEITEICKNVIDYSEEYNVSVGLILSVITVESAFKIDATSSAGARGLMQLLPDTASEVSMEIGKRSFNLLRIKDNIQLGTYYLWKMNNLFGDLDLTISSYNCGPTCVERVKSGEYADYPKETINYLKTVKEWKLMYDSYGVD